jgi:hypothetical protein
MGLFICPGGARDGATSSEHSCGNEEGIMRFAVLRVSVGVAAVMCCDLDVPGATRSLSISRSSTPIRQICAVES